MSALLETKELSAETWPDFERLFSRGHGWDHCWCMAFQRGPRPSRQEFRTRGEVGPRNHDAKKALVDQGRAHGILVYADGEPIGWCQYGSRDELHGSRQADETRPEISERLWWVTCFVVEGRCRSLAGC